MQVTTPVGLNPKQMLVAIGLSGTIALIAGIILGLRLNPLLNTLENQDLSRQLNQTEQKLNYEENLVSSKDELTQEFCTQHQGIK